jgi:peptidoglycan/xylan/chitin deacetylase (PgdA/CDA1 family)
MMSRDEVREIAAVHEIGAHSFDHASMAAETDAYLADDLLRCRAYFGETLGAPVNVYAFPNGSCRDGQIDVVRDAGFEHVLLVGEDFSRTDAHIHKRFTMYAASRAEARFRATGGFRPIPPSVRAVV